MTVHAEPEELPLPEPIEIPLKKQGAVLYLSPMRRLAEDVTVWRWSVRWPGPKEKDPLLAAGGFRSDVAYSAADAEKAGRAAFLEGPQQSRWV